jgi:hypothetical protein
MTVAGGIGHTLPYLISSFYTATAVAAAIVVIELLAIAFIQWRSHGHATGFRRRQSDAWGRPCPCDWNPDRKQLTSRNNLTRNCCGRRVTFEHVYPQSECGCRTVGRPILRPTLLPYRKLSACVVKAASVQSFGVWGGFVSSARKLR